MCRWQLSVSTFACQYNDFSSQRKMLENCLANAANAQSPSWRFVRISEAPEPTSRRSQNVLTCFSFLFSSMHIFPNNSPQNFPSSVYQFCIAFELRLAANRGKGLTTAKSNRIESVNRLMEFWFRIERVNESLLHSDWKLISHFPRNF